MSESSTAVPAKPQAPGDLEIVRKYLNTKEFECCADSISTPAELRDWLVEMRLADPRVRVTAADHRRAEELREALRAQLIAQGQGTVDPDALTTLNRISERLRVQVRFDDAGETCLTSKRGGVEAAFAQILCIVLAAQARGTWERLKVCRSEECLWAYYDQSRNRSGKWCDMKVCGNRAKVKRHRRKKKSPSGRATGRSR